MLSPRPICESCLKELGAGNVFGVAMEVEVCEEWGEIHIHVRGEGWNVLISKDAAFPHPGTLIFLVFGTHDLALR